MEINYKDYMRLPEDVRPYLSQFSITDKHIPLIRKGMFNKNQVQVELNTIGHTTVLGKPSQIKVSDDGVVIGLPSVKFTIPFSQCTDDLENNNYNPDEVFSDFCLYTLQNKKKTNQYGTKSETHCINYKIVAQVNDTETPQELIKEYGVLGAFARILGWMPTDEINRLNFTRLYSVVSGNHIFQLTPPNTGKTHLASRLTLGINYGYFTEKITPARLIFNASSGTQGEVFLRNGIIIDEMVVIREVKELEENLLSGLENGIWSRGVSGAEHLEEHIRKIPFMFFGNLINRRLGEQYNARDELKRILTSLKFTNIDAFTERIAMCDLNLNEVNAGGVVADTFYTNSVLRGFIQFLKEQYREIRAEIDTEYFPKNSRLNKYSQDLEAYCNVIGIKISCSAIKNIIAGYISDLDNLFSTEKPKGELAFKDTSLSIAERIIEYLQYSGGAGFHRLCDELKVSPDEIEPVIADLVKYAEIVEQKKDTIRIYRVM